MSRFRGRRPSHSTIAAYLALFIALGGVSYAAATLPKNSVGPAQIERGAVRSPEVENESLRCNDFNPKSGLCVDAVVRKRTTTVPLTCQDQEFGPGFFQRFCSGEATIKASCKNRESLVSGGYRLPANTPPAPGQPIGTPMTQSAAGVSADRPAPASKTPNGWAVQAQGFGSSSANSQAALQTPPDPEVTVYAVCNA